MAKRYGNRWEIIGASELGEGGQSRVFRVRDLTAEEEAVFALKRVINPKRHERFRTEVEATKRLSHPNIIKVIDHSALDDASGDPEKQYLVMPVAIGGDLSRRERYSLYTGAIDVVIIVAKQLGSALAAAHKLDVIHRDVKPENILFTRNGHEVWLADFGICLIREMDRLTPAGEVVGPRIFMAPELEGGGQLAVTPAADVYSLGKVIYFMFSGGKELPRERLDEAQYAAVFDGGERHRLLQWLLRRMICPLDQRIQTIEEVLNELARIEEWELTAHQLPISKVGLAQFDLLLENAFQTQKICNENMSARQRENATRLLVVDAFKPWLMGQLTTLAEAKTSTMLRVEVREPLPLTVHTDTQMLDAFLGVEFVIQETTKPGRPTHSLQFWLCEYSRSMPAARPTGGPVPFQDFLLDLVFYYRQTDIHHHPNLSRMEGYLVARKSFDHMALSPSQHSARGHRSYAQGSRITPFLDKNLSHHLEFKTSAWPANAETIKESVSEAVGLFVEFISVGPGSIPQ